MLVLPRTRPQTMNDHKGDHLYDTSCDSDSDCSEVSILLQLQNICLACRHARQRPAACCRTARGTVTDIKRLFRCRLPACPTGRWARGRSQLVSGSRLRCDLRQARTTARPALGCSQTACSRPTSAHNSRQITACCATVRVGGNRFPRGHCIRALLKVHLVLQVQPTLPVQPALSVCDTAMEHSTDAQLPVPTAAELLTTLQERVVALEAQCSSQQVDSMQ